MKTTLTNTEVFLESALVKGIVDSFDIVENGYNVVKGDKSLNVIVGVDSALIRDGEKLVEVKSSKLDNVLHHFIMNSLFGTKSKHYFVMSSFEGNTVFTDISGQKWILQGVSPRAANMYFMQFVNNQASDALIANSRLVKYTKLVSSKAPECDLETEVQLMVSDCNPDAYAVNPSPSLINSVGKTVVGNFVVSAADKKVVEDFNKDEDLYLGDINDGAVMVYTRDDYVKKFGEEPDEKSKLESSRRIQSASDYSDYDYDNDYVVIYEDENGVEGKETCQGSNSDDVRLFYRQNFPKWKIKEVYMKMNNSFRRIGSSVEILTKAKEKEEEVFGGKKVLREVRKLNSSKAIKSANLFAPTTPCDVMLDNGKVAPAGCEFEVSYDRNEQGEYILGIEVAGLGEGSIRFDSEAEAKKDGWIVSKAIKSDFLKVTFEDGKQEEYDNVDDEVKRSLMDNPSVTDIETSAGDFLKKEGKAIKSSCKSSINELQSSADTVTITLDNSHKLKMDISKDGIYSAKFKVTPNVKVIEKALLNSGYAFSDIQNVMTLKADDPIVSSVIKSAFEIEALATKPTLVRKVEHLIGSSVTAALRDYGIDDTMQVFSSIDSFTME